MTANLEYSQKKLKGRKTFNAESGAEKENRMENFAINSLRRKLTAKFDLLITAFNNKIRRNFF